MKIFFGLFIFLFAGLANATLITFEGYENITYTNTITRNGFDIGISSGQEQHFHEANSTGYGLPNNGTGVLINDRDTQIFVESSFGSIFSLLSVDIAAYENLNTSLTIEGFLNGFSVGTVSVGSMGSGYTTLFGNSLGNVDRLIFDGINGNGYFVIDNLSLGDAATSVPEPTSLVLLGLSLAGIGFSRKKKAA